MKREYRIRLLKFKIIALFAAVGIVLMTIIGAVSYAVYTANMENNYKKICSSITRVIAADIDGDKVGRWLGGQDMEEYYSLKKSFSEIRNSVEDVENIYAYVMKPEGMQVVFDLNSSEGYSPGKIIDYSEGLVSIKAELTEGRRVSLDLTGDEADGLMTALEPVYNSKNVCVCYAGCDISMARVYRDRLDFMKKLVLQMLLAILLVELAAVLYTMKHIARPINKIDGYLRRFAQNNANLPTVKSDLESMVTDKNEIEILRGNMLELVGDIEKYSYEVAELKDSIVSGITSVIDDWNINAEEHSNVIGRYAKVILDKLRKRPKYEKLIDDNYYNDIIKAAPLYDIGELSIPNDILTKPGKLTEEEYAVVKAHTKAGAELIPSIIKDTQSEQYIEAAQQAAMYHHERWDGSGYPEGLEGEEIPLPARIVAVADVFNAIVSKRSYRSRRSIDEAFDIIKRESRRQFDPDVVGAFVDGRAEVEQIIAEYTAEDRFGKREGKALGGKEKHTDSK